jgi:hypothetical protein
MVDDINPFRVSAHGAKDDRYVNGRHVRLVKWRVMGYLRARDVLFDGMVNHSRAQELAEMRVFDMFGHMTCQVVAVLTNPELASSNFA